MTSHPLLNQWSTTVSSPPAPQVTVAQLNLYNCVGTPGFTSDPPRTISLWVRDLTAGATT